MKTIQFRCPVVLMHSGLHQDTRNECPEFVVDFLQKYSAHQLKINVKPQLCISDVGKTSNTSPRRWFCLSCISTYCKIFSDVFCDYEYIGMPLNFAVIAQMFHNNGYKRNGVLHPVKAINFQMRYRYKNPVAEAQKYQVANFVAQFISCGSTKLLNIAEEKFIEIVEFDKFYDLPEQIVFGRETDKKKLKFTLKKEGGSVLVTTELY